ncbi:hypothetical protein MRB53_038510 [Persea americana]|nr:hypothetical protein MRB53_038510 [Persea americana]
MMLGRIVLSTSDDSWRSQRYTGYEVVEGAGDTNQNDDLNLRNSVTVRSGGHETLKAPPMWTACQTPRALTTLRRKNAKIDIVALNNLYLHNFIREACSIERHPRQAQTPTRL